MPGPGNEDYRLREIERRLSALEDRGSPAAQRLEERLNNERDVRRDTASAIQGRLEETARLLQRDLDEIRNTLTWGIRLFIGSVLLVVVGILIALATGTGAG